jgi:hypothetical protein
MKRLLVSLLLLVSTVVARAELVTIQIPGAPPGLSITVGTGANALPLQNIRTNPNAVNITAADDDWRNVPLGFDFPFFGRVFNNSWAMTNGVVTFQDPMQSGAYGLCCTGVDLRTTTDPRYNYSIFGIHTDLYSWNGQNQYYLREGNSMTYGWYNLSQCCSSQGGNSFEIKINSAGLVDTRIAGAMVQWNAVTSGMSGNLANGEYYQYYHGRGLNITPGSASIFSWQAPNGTGPVDMCIINPLSSPTCPGYQVAYTAQQCTISALFDPSCPGYAAAHLTQQCSTNPLYSQQCPGYQAAYLQQQCSINPLYSTTCSGYQQAYFEQQCSLNTLYSVNCPGYATAYLELQCSLNPLYSTTCSGYQQAYKAQQCSINALYATDCPGYQEAYFSQQCTISGLYSTRCPNYGEAYATQQALQRQNTPTTTTTTTVAETVVVASNTNTSSTPVAVISDPVVNNVVTSTSTSASPAAAATTAVSLTPSVSSTSTSSPTSVTSVATAPAPAKKEEPKENAPSNTQASSGGSTTTASTNNSKTSDSPKPTARQELQARREAAAKAKAVEDGKNLAGNMGKAADMEQQKQIQNVVIQAMGFTPGFDAYQVKMPDVAGYKPFTVYNNQKTIDNRRASMGLFGPSDKVHYDMVDSQYNRKD